MLDITKDVVKLYGCSKEDRCIKCKKKSNCKKDEVKAFRKYIQDYNRVLSKAFYCIRVKGKCKLDNCEIYDFCNKDEKINYLKWKNRYKKNIKKDLEKLMRGGM